MKAFYFRRFGESIEAGIIPLRIGIVVTYLGFRRPRLSFDWYSDSEIRAFVLFFVFGVISVTYDKDKAKYTAIVNAFEKQRKCP